MCVCVCVCVCERERERERERVGEREINGKVNKRNTDNGFSNISSLNKDDISLVNLMSVLG